MHRHWLLALLAACGGLASGHGHYKSVASVASVADPTVNGNTSTDYGINPWVETATNPLSTFAADVDTASYTLARKALADGHLPPPESVRVEEWVNYFHYAFPPATPGAPFSVVIDAAPSPLHPEHHVLRVGVATPAKPDSERKPANLVFLVDVSGSMSEADKLPLAKRALKLLVEQLHANDTIALVTYAGSTRVVLHATPVGAKQRILAAIDDLSSSGSTAMGAGLDLAYDEAMKGLHDGAIARVIVCTDGDANVGTRSTKGMLGIIEERAQAGVTLSTIGFGMGNYRDDMMEQLADKGNGNNYYLDSWQAAQRLFTSELVGMLEVAAKDTKLQLEFDPQQVARYRLIGYENRAIKDEDFRKDKVDAGEIGVGHQVTALYEVELTERAKAAPAPLATLRIRHKAPDGDVATEHTYAMAGAPAPTFAAAPLDLRFAFAVAAFADVLRGAQEASLDDIAQIARGAAGRDADRNELLTLIVKARQLRGSAAATVAR